MRDKPDEKVATGKLESPSTPVHLALEIRIQGRITELESNRQKFIESANQQIAAFNAAIGELQELLKPAEAENAVAVEKTPAIEKDIAAIEATSQAG